MVCTGFIEPLALECILINVFAGTIELFMFIAFIAIAILCARFRMRNGPAMLIFAIFAMMFSSYMPWLYILVIIVGGLVIFFGLKSPFSRD